MPLREFAPTTSAPFGSLVRPATALLVLAGLLGPDLADAAVPTYRVDRIATLPNEFPVLEGHSEAGHVVGGASPAAGAPRAPFVARLGDPMTFLPLPSGYVAGIGYDVNSSGLVVGVVSDVVFPPPSDAGDPALWTPDGSGGYTVQLLQTLSIPTNPRGGGDDGGRAVAINDAGQIVGWTRIRGRNGGPATQFFPSAPPVDLTALGFTGTVRDLSETGVIVGDGLRMDLRTNAITTLGVPPDLQPGNVSFTRVIAMAVNRHEETVVAAFCECGSNPPQHWLTYTHDDARGFERLNPNQLPARFIGQIYDNNDRGDVLAAGGVLFRDEGVLLPGYASLLDAASAARWDVNAEFIGNDRRVYAWAEDTSTSELALVQLTPVAGARPDAGVSLDAGTADASSPVDAGSVSPDAGAQGDAGAGQSDAGQSDAGRSDSPANGCTSTPFGGADAGSLLLLLLVFRRRRVRAG